MSGTVATIEIVGITYAKVVRRYDGDRIHEWLTAFNRSFVLERGSAEIESASKMAYLLRESLRHDNSIRNHSRSVADIARDELTLHRYVNWLVVPFDEPNGEEYRYTLHLDGTVDVLEVPDYVPFA